ncbi:YdcF family protein [Brachybacterium hainanense]|uniref:YdcF family protein n=1 Tax=Brachybacterium hainanense TaxID=1541174 RepID=A0ABV6RGK4_9MICO
MLSSIIMAVLWWAVFWWVFHRDRRRLRNGLLLIVAAWSTISLLLELIAQTLPGGGLLVLAAMLSVFPGVIALAVYLIANGLTMFRKEGRSLGNALSLLAGTGILVSPVLAGILVFTGRPLGIVLGVMIGLVGLHLGLAFLTFLAASLLYQHFPRRLDSTGVIVHGAGLIRGKVTPLLRGRLDAGVAKREELLSRGIDALLVPSGGQGADEPRSEGEAMAEYLVQEAGVPADRVLVEGASRTTEENLAFSHRLLEQHGHTGPFTVVTSRYHAFRAALIARSLGYEDEAIGGPTASYYVPSATLREFVAVMTYRRWWNLVALIPSIAVTALLALAVLAAS